MSPEAQGAKSGLVAKLRSEWALVGMFLTAGWRLPMPNLQVRSAVLAVLVAVVLYQLVHGTVVAPTPKKKTLARLAPGKTVPAAPAAKKTAAKPAPRTAPVKAATRTASVSVPTQRRPRTRSSASKSGGAQ